MYADGGECSASVENTSEIYTILYITMYTKAEFYNNCFIIHSKYF